MGKNKNSRLNGHPHEETQYPVHVYKKGTHKCVTDSISQVTPGGASPKKLVLDASQGFIPLWDENVMLYFRFQDRTLQQYSSDPEGTKNTIRELLITAIEKWGDGVLVRFMENDAIWDFEIAMHPDEDGVLASAFFPDAGQHELVIYPAMFKQPEKEKIDTLIHELGHVFGLRHFFALTGERGFPAKIWGRHSRFSIMNYEDYEGPTVEEESQLTKADKDDLEQLYELVWSRRLRKVNRMPIVLFRPFHSFRP
ncbi:hypothetical protein BGZ82_003286 [Podila clonocystis]|nr:hypothetical protein BGZ82_003286 [Podila clonocystis]